MKKTIIGLICALVTPLAFAQTSTTTTEETTTSTKPATTTETTTSTTYTAGTVTTYEPGKTVVVRSDQGPVRVRVYYTGPTESRTVERVVVEE